MTLGLELYELTIVVVAKNHNPTILNPDFLYRNNIVEEGLDLAEAPITTEVFSRVSFKSGIVIVADSNRVTFVDRNKKSLADKTPLPKIAVDFLQTLEHVSYKAVGINPKGIIEFADSESVRLYLIDSFFKKNSWIDVKDFKLHPKLALSYKGQDKNFTINIEEGIGTDEDKGKHFIVCNANYHRDLPVNEHDKALDEAKKIIENCDGDINHYKSFVTQHFLPRSE